jgi:LPS sulfotransferase NodH
VALSRLPMALCISLFSVINTLLALVQRLVYGRRIARTQLCGDPIFILGHWRSGTTLLHELLVLDQRFTCPTTYACLAPTHFLISRCLVPWWMRFLMPKRRPMDNMRVDWRAPQEDEWALCVLGVRTPYSVIAFPQSAPRDMAYADLRGLSPQEKSRWQQTLLWFFRCLTVQSPRQLVVKSPLHTARIEAILEMFPQARFVHIVRDPQTVYPSTLRLWQRLSADHGLQPAATRDWQAFVLNNLREMYDAFESTKGRIAPERFCEVRYEALVADPVGQLERIYQHLGLEAFEQVRPALEAYVANTSDYRPNRYPPDPETKRMIAAHWGEFLARYGYEDQGSTTQGKLAAASAPSILKWQVLAS